MALGRGLDALLGDPGLLSQESGSKSLPVSQIDNAPGQPRRQFDADAMAELTDSIRQHGLLQPITVRRLTSGRYQIIAGERRWRACKAAGLTEIPAMVIEADGRKAAELALIENLQREDLNPIEEAAGYQSLIEEYGLTQEEAAARVSRSRSSVANLLRLLSLPEEVREMIISGALSAGHGKALLGLGSPEEQLAAARTIAERGLSVREAETLCRQKKSDDPPKDAPAGKWDSRAEALTKGLGRRVTISAGKKRGKLTLEFRDEADLEALLTFLEETL